jgi:hypothetical protein
MPTRGVQVVVNTAAQSGMRPDVLFQSVIDVSGSFVFRSPANGLYNTKNSR